MKEREKEKVYGTRSKSRHTKKTTEIAKWISGGESVRLSRVDRTRVQDTPWRGRDAARTMIEKHWGLPMAEKGKDSLRMASTRSSLCDPLVRGDGTKTSAWGRGHRGKGRPFMESDEGRGRLRGLIFFCKNLGEKGLPTLLKGRREKKKNKNPSVSQHRGGGGGGT